MRSQMCDLRLPSHLWTIGDSLVEGPERRQEVFDERDGPRLADQLLASRRRDVANVRVVVRKAKQPTAEVFH